MGSPGSATQAGSTSGGCRGAVRGYAARTHQGWDPGGGALLEEGLAGSPVVQWFPSRVVRKTNERAAGRAQGLGLGGGLAGDHWGPGAGSSGVELSSRSHPESGAAGFETGEPTAAGTRAERSGGSRMAETVGAVALIVAPARLRCLWSVLAAMLGLCECCGAGPGRGREGGSAAVRALGAPRRGGGAVCALRGSGMPPGKRGREASNLFLWIPERGGGGGSLVLQLPGV